MGKRWAGTSWSSLFVKAEAAAQDGPARGVATTGVVCAVVADSEVQAKRAAKRVKIVYQDLEPVILTIEEAIRHHSFFQGERKLEYGNVDEAFKVVDQILEGEIHMGGQEHFYMETQSMLAVPKGEDQEMDVYVSSQFPKYIQDIVAATLKVPANKIMCHVKRVGGAFGGKVTKTGIMAAITAFAANKHGRPVRCILERGEDMLITGGRHPYLGKYKVSRGRRGAETIHVVNMTLHQCRRQHLASL
nr:PREDICTED: aldehyde oxidase 1-like [Equus przewalskii]